MKMRLMQINIGVGSLPAVSNRIMEIRELRPSVCLSFGGRSVLNHLRLGRGKKSLRAGRPSSDQHLEVSNVKTGGRRRIVYHHIGGKAMDIFSINSIFSAFFVDSPKVFFNYQS